MILSPGTDYPLAVLIKSSSYKEEAIVKHYLEPMINQGLPEQGIAGYALPYNGKKAPAVSKIREYLTALACEIQELGIKYLLCCDGAYFKVLTGSKKAEPHYGYVLPAKLEGYEGVNVVLCPNWQGLIYNPAVQERIDLSLNALVSHQLGQHVHLGTGIIHQESYPDTYTAITEALNQLHQYPELTCDIEAFSLKHWLAGIGTIAFAWNQHEGLAFCVDYKEKLLPTADGFYGDFVPDMRIRELLKQFLCSYKGKLIFHNANYDVKVLIYTLWMENILDHHGLIEGLETLEYHIEDTKLIAYLATNNCNENRLDLKSLAHEFAGNYAQDDIKDIRRISKQNLLTYNLVDCLSTWFVHDKYYPIMVQDQQEELYQGLFKESMRNILQMELTGMPMNMAEVKRGEKELRNIHVTHERAIMADSYVGQTIEKMQQDFIIKDFAERKTKAKNPGALVIKDIDKMRIKPTQAFPMLFNPGSGKQLAMLLHDVIGLPIIETTPTGLPATDDDTLKALRSHTQDQQVVDLIEHIRGVLGVQKILSTFIPAFEGAVKGPDGHHYLFGSFNLGRVKSGRLSSSEPNLQQIPSGSTYAKVIKKMFQAPPGWIFGGSDYASLEDRINTLLTKDPNKLKVYTDGYDGHSLRAFNYFPERLTEVHAKYEEAKANGASSQELVAIINSIDDLYGDVRQDSKAPTFALTYQGTWSTLMKNCGFSEAVSKDIEANYHKMYAVSTAWVHSKLAEASECGYVTLAYGLRLRTPLLKRVVYGSGTVPREAAAEARTAGNAVSGQSYGLINTKAGGEFMRRVRVSKYRYDVRMCAQIHDAIYLMWPDDIEITQWVNENLVDCMVNQTDELPEIQHDEVKLGANLDLYWPSWKESVTLPNHASQETIRQLAEEHSQKLLTKQAA